MNGDFLVSAGGDQFSARNADHAVHLALGGLATSPPTAIVLIHDTTAGHELLDEVAAVAASGAGNGVAVVATVTETVKELDADGFVVATLPRERLLRMLMAQAAGLSQLRAVHRDCSPDGDPELLCLVGEPADVAFLRLEDLAVPAR